MEAVSFDTARRAVAEFFAKNNYSGKRLLLIVPDNTRSGPIGDIFQIIYDCISPQKPKAVDILVALGTHQPMTDKQICTRLSITDARSQDEICYGEIFQSQLGKPVDLHFNRQNFLEGN